MRVAAVEKGLFFVAGKMMLDSNLLFMYSSYFYFLDLQRINVGQKEHKVLSREMRQEHKQLVWLSVG